MKKVILLVPGLLLCLIAMINAQTNPPTNLSYKHNPVTYVTCTAITPDTPIVTGTTVVDSFTVMPALPAGLSLDKATGIIIGIPTTATATANYTVTARNAAGSATVALSITVTASLLIVAGYSTDSATYMIGTAITPDTPRIYAPSYGCTVDSYTVAPTLPAGLTLDAGSGVITGTPTRATATATYTVTAQFAAGFVTVSLSITVIDPTNIMSFPVLPDRCEIRIFNVKYSHNIVQYALPDKYLVNLKYFDSKGRTVASFVNKIQSAGYYSLLLQSASWPRGAYIQVFKAGSFEKREIITIVR